MTAEQENNIRIHRALTEEINVEAMREVLRTFSRIKPAYQKKVVDGESEYTISVLGYVRIYRENGGR